MPEVALYGINLFGDPIEPPSRGKVADDFVCPPFSVLSSREGWWQERKAGWIGRGIQGEVGRSDKLTFGHTLIEGVMLGDKNGQVSVFDPVLCELVYRWFCPPDGLVLDPFAGGSVRGIVAALLGRRYHGIELRPEQVAANREQAGRICPDAGRDGETLTPVQRFGDWWAKREDVAGFVGVDQPSGAKVRAFGKMIAAAPDGTPLVVGGSADSLMQVYVAAAARAYGRPAHVIVPRRRRRSDETDWAAGTGAEIEEISPGYPSQCRAAAREWAAANGGAVRWDPAISTADTAEQVANIPAEARRIVVPCGSGAITAGVMAGLAIDGRADVMVLAVAVSDKSDPAAIVALAERYGGGKPLPSLEWVRAPGDYADRAEAVMPDGTALDPAYAAKALPYVQPGDVLWVSGRRAGLAYVPPPGQGGRLTWVIGDARDELPAAPPADLIFSCPPYADLERYSDDPRDLSTMAWPAFLDAYRGIIGAACSKLRPDRFACFVVGDVRDPAGCYRNLPGETIRAFTDAGLRLYNEAVLATPVGSLPIRINAQFTRSRKLGKTHQNILIFVKGCPKRATAAIPLAD